VRLDKIVDDYFRDIAAIPSHNLQQAKQTAEISKLIEEVSESTLMIQLQAAATQEVTVNVEELSSLSEVLIDMAK